MNEERIKYLKSIRRKAVLVWVLRFAILAAFVGLWELAARLEWVDPFISSSPTRIAKTIADLYKSHMLFNHLFATLLEAAYGFLLSTVLGTIIAIALWVSETAQRVAEPYLIVLNALPKVALGPLIIIWVGAGKGAIITMALLIALIITVISMLAGFTSVDKEKIALLRSMEATKAQILFKLVLPANVPTLMSVLKINVGLAWVGVIMGEYLVSREGIGYLIVYGSQVFKLDLVMASTILLCAMASMMYLLVAALEKIINKRF